MLTLFLEQPPGSQASAYKAYIDRYQRAGYLSLLCSLRKYCVVKSTKARMRFG